MTYILKLLNLIKKKPFPVTFFHPRIAEAFSLSANVSIGAFKVAIDEFCFRFRFGKTLSGALLVLADRFPGADRLANGASGAKVGAFVLGVQTIFAPIANLK